MAEAAIDTERICEIVRRLLREGFPLYDESHEVFAAPVTQGVSISYRTKPDPMTRDTTYFDVNIIGDVCYNINTAIAPEHWGHGHGKKLHRVIEEIGREFNCKRVQFTASGQLPSGRSRVEYMEDLGYHKVEGSHDFVVEILLDG